MKKKPAFRISFFPSHIQANGRKHWSWRVISTHNGRIILSSTAQLYSRLCDSKRVARRFVRACANGKVEIE